MTNPLLEDHELPPFHSIRAEHMVPAIETLILENRDLLEKLLAEGKTGWHELIGPLEEQDDRLSNAFAPIRNINAVMNSPEVREAYNKLLPSISQYSTERKQHVGLFEAYRDIATSDEYGRLRTSERKAVDNALRDFRLTGIDLPPAQRTRFAQIATRLSEVSSQFNDNVLDATMAWSKQVEDEAELSGIPEANLAVARQTAEQRGEPGYVLTLDFPCYLAVMDYCENRELREEMYEAFATRASDVGPYAGRWDNSALMKEILSLRVELAGLLGYENYAEYSLATKMARSTDQVMEFLNNLAAKGKPAADREFEDVCNYARDVHGVAGLEPWDVGFYSEKLKQHKFDVSEEQLRPWFPADRVIAGMFEVVRRLYGIDIRQTDDMETWHEDVTTYHIFRQGELVARFYLDPYARTNKQGGAWMDECRVRRVCADGSIQLPTAFLTCNFTPSIGGKPSLLTHSEVVTLFHEFGHGLHHMLTQVDCADVSGINGVAWDAVELPSQFMENWCWEQEALQFISGHSETGEPLPAELLDKLLAARNFQSAMRMVRQLEFALFDFRLHLEFDPGRDGQIEELLNEVRSQVAVVPAPSYRRFPNSFGHIFGGGYAAGYYSYKWAEVLSADAFSRFSEEGIFNRQTGEKFLDTILEVGGSVDAMDMFVAFMGREPDVAALLRQDGIPT